MEKLPDIAHDPVVRELILRALDEDVGPGDATSEALVGAVDIAEARIVAHTLGVLSGGSVAAQVFRAVDPSLQVDGLLEDGAPLKGEDVVLTVSGSARSILTAERLALNLLQRMTGIASMTRTYVEKVAHTKAVILDTRKTLPNLRVLEKYAVLCGGGVNHRFGLYDQVLIKDNHLAFWRKHGGGRLDAAVREAREKFPDLEIEVEVESLAELLEALPGEPDWVLLDNMKPADLRRCVEACGGRCKLEASGGITLDTLASVADTGVDAISVGALTHSVVAADLSLDLLV